MRRAPRAIALVAVLTVTATAQPAGGFPADARRAAAELARLTAPDATARLARLKTENPERRVTILRAGLMSLDDAVARACAVHLEWTELDEREHARVFTLLRDRFATPGTAVDFEKFRSMIGSTELSWIYRNPPPPPWERHLTHHLGNLHRQARAEHIPLLLELTKHDDAKVRGEAWGTIFVITPRTDQYRDRIASAFLALGTSWAALRQATPKPATGGPSFAYSGSDGLAPALRAVLRRNATRPHDHAPPWALRWLMQSRPNEADATLLIALANTSTGDDLRPAAALRAMRHQRDPATRSTLLTFADESNRALRAIAVGSLAHRGEKGMKERLARQVPDDELALALLAEVDPDATREAIARAVFEGPSRIATKWLDAFTDKELGSIYFIDCHLDFSSLQARAASAEIDGMVLARAGAELRGLHTPAVARAAANRLLHGDLPALPSSDALGFIEVAAPGSLRPILDRMDAQENTNLVELAAVLRGILRPPHPGWPPGVVSELFGGDEPDPPAPAEELERRFADYLQTEPRGLPTDLWRMNRPEVYAFLRRLQRKRSLGLYAEATAHLACMNDDAARFESLAAMKAGRYRWVDEVFSEAELAVFGRDFQTMIPFWLGELESNCCRAVIARNVFEDLFGLEVHIGEGDSETESTRMRRWWKHHRDDDFRWSRLARKYVPVSLRR